MKRQRNIEQHGAFQKLLNSAWLGSASMQNGVMREEHGELKLIITLAVTGLSLYGVKPENQKTDIVRSAC